MNNNNFNYKKQLPEVFKELQEMQRQNIYQEMNRKRIYEYNQPRINHKFNAIGAIIGILFLILFLTTIKSNYIFATTPEDEKKIIGKFEQNNNPIEIMDIISENMSEVVKKNISTEEQIIERETE